MANNPDKKYVETSIIPIKYVDFVEDIFHAILALSLFIIGIGEHFSTQLRD